MFTDGFARHAALWLSAGYGSLFRLVAAVKSVLAVVMA